LYSIVYVADCSIGSTGILHLSKAKWGRLDALTLSILLFIKAKIKFWVRT
jgi:hypothetical protein